MCVLSRVQLFATPWTVARQAPLSMEFSRQEYWSGLPCPPPGDLPHPGIKPKSPASPALTGGFFTPDQESMLCNRRSVNMCHVGYISCFWISWGENSSDLHNLLYVDDHSKQMYSILIKTRLFCWFLMGGGA